MKLPSISVFCFKTFSPSLSRWCRFGFELQYFYCFCLFVLFYVIFFPVSFTRNELLLRNSTPNNFLPTFEHSDILLDILVGGAAILYKRSKRRKRGKHAGALLKFRQCRFRTPLLSIHLANLRSLANEADELLLLTRTKWVRLSNGLPAVQSGLRHRVIWENDRRWIMFLCQLKVGVQM